MRLYLVQHGDALAAETDPDRPLSDNGRRDVEQLGIWLGRHEIDVATVLHSGKTRAGQTAEILRNALESKPPTEAVDYLGPKDSLLPLLEVLDRRQHDLMVVGHLPFLGRLLARLVARDEDSTVASFVPGTSACLERTADGTWTIVSFIRPEDLR